MARPGSGPNSGAGSSASSGSEPAGPSADQGDEGAWEALHDLRQARKDRRLERVDIFEAIYQAYLAAIVAVAAVLFLSGLVGDEALGPDDLASVRQHGAGVVSLVLALTMAAAVRAGGQGGPLAVERADVAHVLLAPLPRRILLRGAAWARVRTTVLVRAATGLGIGVVAAGRLPGADAGWAAAGTLAGAVSGLLGAGLAMLVSGHRVGRRRALVIGLVLVGWSAADAGFGVATSPLTGGAQLALWPLLDPGPAAVAMVVLAPVVAAVGARRAGGLSLEAAERRAALVGQLRFAATMRDLRTVVLLRRQLAQERPRRRPWLPVRPGRRPITALWSRDWDGLLRWPPARAARAIAMAAIAGVALRGVWAGTTALVVVAGLAAWLAALDLVEGLAQEVDHPSVAALHPRETGLLLVGHLAAPAAAALGLVGVGTLAAMAVPGADPGLLLSVAGATAIPAAACAVGAAAVSTARGAPDIAGAFGFSPETAGFRLLIREVLPPAIAASGMVPVLAARQAAAHGGPPGQVAASAWPVLFLAGAVGLWLARRELA